MYSRLFPDLSAWQPRADNLVDQLELLQQYAVDHLFAEDGQVADNPELPAGYTYFGQFVDHDLTFDCSPPPNAPVDPASVTNYRTEGLALQCLYGMGPRVQPFLYDQSRGNQGYSGYLSLGSSVNADGSSGTELDLARDAHETALIADPRNDENRIVAQLHAAIAQLHNCVLGELAGNQVASPAEFIEARRIVTWAYQYVVVNDFLRRILDVGVYAEVFLQGGGINVAVEFRDSSIPVEFAAAAYRFGHSLIRPNYLLNHIQGDAAADKLPIFSRTQGADLRGERRLPRAGSVLWNWFFDVGDVEVKQHLRQRAQLIRPRLSQSVFAVPRDDGLAHPLAWLNLRRGLCLGLPGGMALARRLDLPVVAVEDESDPLNCLWVYVLHEAEILAEGKRLGPLGSWIVANTFANTLRHNPASYVSCRPGWEPDNEPLLNSSASAGAGFSCADLLRCARVPVSRREIDAAVLGEWSVSGLNLSVPG